MVDRRLAERMSAVVAAYLHPDFYLGEHQRGLFRVAGDGALSCDEIAELVTWLWSKHSVLAAGIEAATEEPAAGLPRDAA